MRPALFLAAICLSLGGLSFWSLPFWPLAAQDGAADIVPRPAAVIADGIPPVPKDLADTIRQYRETRGAAFQAWDPKDRSMVISTRFGDTTQLHRVKMPGGARTQITFEAEPVAGAALTENGGDVLLTQKDIGGNEFYQIHRIEDGRLILLTDGESRNGLSALSPDGSLIAYSSTRRNGRDSDLYIMNPRDPATARMILERDSVGWSVTDIAPDARQAVVQRYISITDSELYLLDLQTGALDMLSDAANRAAYSSGQFDSAGRFWVISDLGSDFARLGTLDLATGAFTPVIEETWDISGFAISPDDRFLAYEVNAAGRSALKIYALDSGTVRDVPMPPGILGGLDFAPWGDLGFTFGSNRSPLDAYSLDPETLEITRWTFSETGGLDASKNVLPELVEIESFDSETVSGFLYRPDRTKFPGKRPLIVDIHGGPEAQTTAGYKGSANYLINELGVAFFYPNVRGSSGYGKRFVSLDNGPFQREDSVRDIGAVLDRFERDPLIDAERMAVTGGSYGGYMCYAGAIYFGDRLKAASCAVAISDFVTFLENTQDYRRDLRRVEYGDERDPQQRAKLKEISPLTRADEISIPLFVATGANDPRVPASEADQIIAAVRANGGEAWHFLATNEGHGFAKKENADYYIYSELMFWQRFLLGE